MNSCTGVYEKSTITLPKLLKSVKEKPGFRIAGAVAVFIGVVRGETSDGDVVKKLELEAYKEKANRGLARICDELRKRDGVVDVQIHHLLGEFNVGEDLVYVLVAGAHRHNVLPVLEEAVESYKKEVPIFKKEYAIDKKGVKKSYWVSERACMTNSNNSLHAAHTDLIDNKNSNLTMRERTDSSEGEREAKGIV